MVIGLDIDDTITRHPEFFAFLSAAAIATGHRVLILTMRVDRAHAESDLRAMGIVWSELHTFPEDRTAAGYWSWKGELCRQHGVDLYFDDSPDILEHMPPSTFPFLALDLPRHRVGRIRECDDDLNLLDDSAT
jgi:hypothetical protein